jgi:hypothetical protein
MIYIFLSLFLFAASVAAHIFFCRITKTPGLHAKVFVIIALGALGLYLGGSYILQHSNLLDPDTLWGLPFKITGGVIFIALIPIYLSFYVLTQLMSPSKKILSAVLEAGELSRKDIVAAVKEEGFITTRLNDLCLSGCVKEEKGQYILSSHGRKIARVLNFMQLILGRKAGG